MRRLSRNAIRITMFLQHARERKSERCRIYWIRVCGSSVHFQKATTFVRSSSILVHFQRPLTATLQSCAEICDGSAPGDSCRIYSFKRHGPLDSCSSSQWNDEIVIDHGQCFGNRAYYGAHYTGSIRMRRQHDSPH